MNIHRPHHAATRRTVVLIAGMTLVGLSMLATTAFAQSTPPTTNWRTILLPQVDLWYHGLATMEFRGLGPYEMYEAGYSSRLRDAKTRVGVPPTELDNGAPRFMTAFDRDSTFEVFHFVPLYFASATVEPMLGALEEVAGDERSPAVNDRLALFGANAVAATITRPDQRSILADWTQALRTEWDDFFAAYWRERAVQAAPTLRSVQAEWDAHFAPRLARYLQAYALDNGVLVLSDPVGPEGRIFEGRPTDRSDNIVVVGFDEDGPTRAPLYAAVREMCFPVVREALSTQPEMPDRVSNASRSSNAAARCGAHLLDRFAPDLAPEYRSTLLPGISGSPADVRSAFERKYVTSAELDAALQDRLGAIPVP